MKERRRLSCGDGRGAQLSARGNANALQKKI